MAGTILCMGLQYLLCTGVCGRALPAGRNLWRSYWNTYRIFVGKIIEQKLRTTINYYGCFNHFTFINHIKRAAGNERNCSGELKKGKAGGHGQ